MCVCVCASVSRPRHDPLSSSGDSTPFCICISLSFCSLLCARCTLWSFVEAASITTHTRAKCKHEILILHGFGISPVWRNCEATTTVIEAAAAAAAAKTEWFQCCQRCNTTRTRGSFKYMLACDACVFGLARYAPWHRNHEPATSYYILKHVADRPKPSYLLQPACAHCTHTHNWLTPLSLQWSFPFSSQRSHSVVCRALLSSNTRRDAILPWPHIIDRIKTCVSASMYVCERAVFLHHHQHQLPSFFILFFDFFYTFLPYIFRCCTLRLIYTHIASHNVFGCLWCSVWVAEECLSWAKALCFAVRHEKQMSTDFFYSSALPRK